MVTPVPGDLTSTATRHACGAHRHILAKYSAWAVVAHIFNPSRRQTQVDLCEFAASLVYRENSRTGSKATEKPCLKKQKQTNK